MFGMRKYEEPSGRVRTGNGKLRDDDAFGEE